MPVPDPTVTTTAPSTGPAFALSAADRAAFSGDARAAFAAARARLAGAGYGGEVPRVFAEAARQVAEHLGSDLAISLAPAASRLAIKTRPRIAALFLRTAAAMAPKLDANGFARWEAMVLNLLRDAPDTVLPLLERMEMLNDRLGLEALEAWIATGLRLSGRDAETRSAFFRLELPEAQRLLEQHAGRQTYQSLERGLRLFHTALWGRMPPMREAPPDGKMAVTRRSSFASGIITMPPSYPGHHGAEARLYRAAMAHLGAHFAYGGDLFPVLQLKPMQIAVVSLIEDARVETLAMRDMPGLRALWLPFHTVAPEGVATAPSLFSRLARALIDPDFPIRHGWVEKGLRMFQEHAHQLENPALSRHIGNLLGNDLGQTRVQFNARNHVVQPAYRDDNLGLWAFEDEAARPAPDQILIDTNDLNPDQSGQADPQDTSSKPDAPSTASEQLTISSEGRSDGEPVMALPEYDQEAQVERPEWVTVREYAPPPGDPQFWQRLEESHGPLMAQIEALIRSASVGRARRLKRQAEGDKLDIDAAIEASIDMRSRHSPDHRVFEGVSLPERSIAVHLLLDMSQSTADRVRGDTILSLEQSATAILARAMTQLGDPLAITAFASAGREDMRVIPIKRFDDDLDMVTGMKLSGLTPGYSTRIGAALRYAAAPLARVARHRRLVLLLTDGEPSDIDVPDNTYLVKDAKRAVQTLSAQGIDAYCIALGQGAGQRQAEIFGRNGFIQIDRLQSLPEKLTALYLRLTK